MLNAKTLKLNRILNLKEFFIKSNEQDYRLTKEQIEELKREKEEYETAKASLGITEEMRKKDKNELTEEEKDLLYEEYVLDAAIGGTVDFIEGNYYDFDTDFKKVMKEVKHELKMMQS